MEYIIPIITVSVTLLLGVLGFIVNSLIQRKSNSIQVITKTRLARREKTKELMSKMIMLSNINYLNTNDNKDSIRLLIETSSNIRSEYSQVFECDRRLIDITESLTNSIIGYLNNPNEDNKIILNNNRNVFIKDMDIYIQTEWKRIKLETVGKMNNSKFSSWNEIYNQYQNDYK